MCHLCADPTAIHATRVPRRGFLTLAGATMASLAISRDGFAEAPKAPPKQENVLSPQAALQRLMKGNERYVEGVSRRHDFKHEREALTQGSEPVRRHSELRQFAHCARIAFDTGRGDLFVCRVAGNFFNTDVIASFEYAVAVLNTPLLMVLGHQLLRRSRCRHQIDPRRHHAAGPSALPGRGDQSRGQGHGR